MTVTEMKEYTEQVINEFINTFEKGKKYKVKEFMAWHMKITHACTDGAENWLKGTCFYPEDEYTVDEFLFATRNIFRPVLMRRLRKAWKEKCNEQR